MLLVAIFAGCTGFVSSSSAQQSKPEEYHGRKKRSIYIISGSSEWPVAAKDESFAICVLGLIRSGA